MTIANLDTRNPENLIRHDWQLDEVLELFDMPFNDLLFKAQTIHRQFFDPNEVQVSTLLSIKTGGCPENCSYCPQSAHYSTGVEKENLMKVEDILSKAVKAKEAGASRFCMGAAWRNLHDKDLPFIVETVKQVKSLGMETCMTLGMLSDSQVKALEEAGLDYYNHNIDTSKEYYEKIITTRNFQDRLDTLEKIRNSKIKACCGGITGMGETIQDRANMLITLANMPSHPESVPLNTLIRIKGTPLGETEKISTFDFIRAVAVARIMMPNSAVRLSAGRAEMSEEMQALCFFAGANSIHYGEKLLTTLNSDQNEDMEMFKKLGIKPMKLKKEEAAA